MNPYVMHSRLFFFDWLERPKKLQLKVNMAYQDPVLIKSLQYTG